MGKQKFSMDYREPEYHVPGLDERGAGIYPSDVLLRQFRELYEGVRDSFKGLFKK